ncbi:MAG: twin-arginine translocation signal domain-containing protein, partial [Myxococcota bacterium]
MGHRLSAEDRRRLLHMERGTAGLNRRQFLTLAGLALGGAACSPGPYAMPILRRGDDDTPMPSMKAKGLYERDVSAYLPEGLTGRYFFGGGYMGREGIEPQSILVELDANRGVVRRSAYTYDIDEGKPLTRLAGADAVELLEVVRRIAG